MFNVKSEHLLTRSQKKRGCGIHELEQQWGQEVRDRIRLDGLVSLGFTCKTLDDKHAEERAIEGSHCQASFLSHSYRLKKNLIYKWGHIEFDVIILDYFFSPVSLVNFN